VLLPHFILAVPVAASEIFLFTLQPLKCYYFMPSHISHFEYISFFTHDSKVTGHRCHVPVAHLSHLIPILEGHILSLTNLVLILFLLCHFFFFFLSSLFEFQSVWKFLNLRVVSSFTFLLEEGLIFTDSVIVNMNHQEDKVFIIHTCSFFRTIMFEMKILGELLYVCSYFPCNFLLHFEEMDDIILISYYLYGTN